MNRAHVWAFAGAVILSVVGNLAAQYLINNVRAVRNAVGPL